MYTPSTDWLEQVKNAVNEMVKNISFVLEGTITSVDSSPPYKVKVMLHPYEIETGWLKVSTPYIGNGFGLIVPPPAEGTAVKVIFDMGDIKNGTVIGGVFNDDVTMPTVTYGTAGMIHETGSSFLLNQDGSIKINHPSGSFISIGTDGTVTIKGKNSSTSW